jgi:aminoglycoside phosphotransferase (APT) family kinase protein
LPGAHLGTPVAEIAVDDALVRRLLAAQHPDLAALPLNRVASGWDNITFRLGERLAVRVPRREAGAPLIVNERWLGAFAPWLPLPTPAPVRAGAATDFYPWPWSIVRWIDGAAPTGAVALPEPEALRLAAFLKTLHRAAPDSAPANDVRGVPLAARAPAVEERFPRLAYALAPPVRAAWTAALAAPVATQRVWLHGDLHPTNVLLKNGALAAIIDWGDICAGDAATDLAAFWMLFEAGPRDAGLAAYGADAALIARARGWAISFGSVLLDTGRIDNPIHAAIGAATLARAAT